MNAPAETALLAVSQMQREALDPKPLIEALTARMMSDPKLAMEAVAGKCEWDSSYSSSHLDELSILASDMAFDLEQARTSPDLAPVESRAPSRLHRIATLKAASDALCMIASDREQEERLARWAAEDTPMPRGHWSGVSQKDFL